MKGIFHYTFFLPLVYNCFHGAGFKKEFGHRRGSIFNLSYLPFFEFFLKKMTLTLVFWQGLEGPFRK